MSLLYRILMLVVALLLLPFIGARIVDGAAESDLELSNGVIRLKANIDYGGAITYLSLADKNRNIINNYDHGRQVQQSYYAGQSIDRRSEGQSPAWSPWSWNPIGAGDCYGNKPKIVSKSNDGATIYVKTVPLLWDMNNEAAECYFETWITLQSNVAHVRNKLTVFRSDDKWKAAACHQELPAVYSIGDLHHLYTYEGTAPFTNAPLKEIVNNGPPWASWGNGAPHEKWAALVDDKNWGLGVYNPKTELFTGGFHGKPGGGARDDATGYIAPLRSEILDKNSVYEYDYHLIVGNLDEIRDFVYTAEGHKNGK